MSLLKLPYTNLHELNLDWIIEQLNKEGAVLAVNGKHGIVVLTGEDITRTANNPQTVEQALTSQGSSIQAVRTEIGVTPLPTTAQTITGAIAEHETDITNINTEIGTTALPTTAQTLTGAIAENAGEIADIQDNVIGSTALPTTAQTLTGAIAENAGEIAGIQDDIGSTALPTTAQTITGAIAEHETDITNINTKIGTTPLPTTAQTLTGAIAEHETDIAALQTNDCKVAVFNWEPTGADASVTAGTAVTIDSVSNIIPAGGNARGVIKFSAYGASNYDYDGSLMIVSNNLRFMPKLTQTSIKVYGAIIYTM